MANYEFDVIEGGITVGTTVTTGATTANVALPVNSSGDIARVCVLSATVACHVRLGGSTVVATANDLMVLPGNYMILNTRGSDFIAYIQEGSAAKLTISPCEV